MTGELMISYSVWIMDTGKEIPILVPIGKSKVPSAPGVFAEVEYFFLDTPGTRELILCLSDHQRKILKPYGVKNKILTFDLEDLTGAAKWELLGKKTLQYKKEIIQMDRCLLTNPDYLDKMPAHITLAEKLPLSNDVSEDLLTRVEASLENLSVIS